jgi:hypothetical protein
LTIKSDIDEACVYLEIDGEGVRMSKAQAAHLAEYLTEFCGAVDGLSKFELDDIALSIPAE